MLAAGRADAYLAENAVANFFTPTSQKGKDRTTWTERSPDNESAATLLVAKYAPEDEDAGTPDSVVQRRKIAAFDLVLCTAAPYHDSRAHSVIGFNLDHQRLRQATP